MTKELDSHASTRTPVGPNLASQPKTSRVVALRRLVRRAPALGIGGSILLVLLLITIIGPFLAQDPNAQSIANRLDAPSADHWFGRDEFGRDILARMIHGARVTLGVSTSVASLAGFFGLALGLTAGYFRYLDNVLMRIMDGLMAFPGIVLALGLVAALGPRISNIIIALSVVYIPNVTRLMRSGVLSLREQDYVLAARAVGAHEVRIVTRHITPNLIAPLVVQVSFIFAFAIVAEAGLSFLGVGAPAHQPTWGTILATARSYIHQAPYMTLIPGLAMFVTVLGLNFLGDGLQDALDPRMRRRAVEQ
jgi:peptide/nickel transport system permease protein